MRNPIDKEKTCCFTGHRQLSMSENDMKAKLYDLIMTAYEKGYRHFICGGAVGFDMLVAEQIIFLKNTLAEITLEIAVPCQEQDKKYSELQKIRYNFILKHADKITKRDLPYDRYCMFLRNKYMVDNSSLVIAYYKGKPSGTKNTIDYAKEKGINIWFIN